MMDDNSESREKCIVPDEVEKVITKYRREHLVVLLSFTIPLSDYDRILILCLNSK